MLYRTDIPIPPDTDRLDLEEAVRMIRDVAEPRLAIIFDSDDEYDLALRVASIENELRSIGFVVNIDRPTPVTAKKRTAAQNLAELQDPLAGHPSRRAAAKKGVKK